MQTRRDRKGFFSGLLLILALSFLALPGSPVASRFFGTVQPAKANPAPAEAWYPAGPAMNYLQSIIFTDAATEFTNFQTNQVDLTDVPLYSSLVSQLEQRSGYYVAPSVESSAMEFDFNMANNFWGCSFSFGNSACGDEIRQGLAHLVDKVSFSTNDASIAPATAIDDPSGFELATANPCNWDASFPETGNGCIVGARGGIAYHLAPATGVNYAWQPALGSPDFCAAAQHFINAGIASGKNGSTCVLNRISSGVTSHTVQLYVRNDNSGLSDLGVSMGEEICALFGQGFSFSCPPYVSYFAGNVDAFPGFASSSPSQPNLNWWMYTNGAGAFDNQDGFSDTIDHYSQFQQGTIGEAKDLKDVLGDLTFNTLSDFYINGGPFGHPECASGTSSYAPSDYGAICNPGYDSIANALYTSPCLSASGDPTVGQTLPSFATCPGTNQLTATSAAYQAEAAFGKNVFAIPVTLPSANYAYLSNWSRVINDVHSGIFNYFSWLNGYASNPSTPLTLRQGFSQGINYLNPYALTNPWDLALVRTIYDSLQATDPATGEVFDELTTSAFALGNSQLGYTPPPGTVLSIRYTLRNDAYFQDNRQVTAWDVKFSLATLRATGSYFSADLQSMVCSVPTSCTDGATVLRSDQIDVHLTQSGIAANALISSVPILPGRYWSGPPNCQTSSWDNDVASGNVPDSCMTADPTKATVGWDTVQNWDLIGAGPWMCRGWRNSQLTVGGGCTTTGTSSVGPGGSISLTRFGIDSPPAASESGSYFRSSGTLALDLWSGMNGGSSDFTTFTRVESCFGQPVGVQSCVHYQQGIGNPDGDGVNCCTVGTSQVSIAERFFGVPWVGPFDFSNPPGGMEGPPMTLYEGTFILLPLANDPVGCSLSYNRGGGYDC